MSGHFRLEAHGASAQVVAAYDAATDEFRFAGRRGFWQAVDRAHALGVRGRGQRVAVVDAMCDLALPRLQAQVDLAGSGPPHAHGTAVALLISRIAPDCRLDIYPIVDAAGDPDIDLARPAIVAAAHSPATVLNLSLGIERDFARRQVGDDEVGLMVNHPHRWLAQVSPDDPDCPLCPAVKGAVDRGALVFAAAGNDPRVLCCPARSEGVIAVGFQRGTRRIVTGPNGKSLENASAAGPGQQSVAWDLGVDEIDGVPGTSFACPLYAGVGALGLSAAEVDGYGASTRFGRLAMTWHAYLRAGAFTPERLAATGKFYERSLMCLPHVHSTVEACLRPDVRSSDPSTCWSCGIFAEGTYVSAGLFFLETGRLAEGTGLLQAARRLAPWSVDAAANLGLAHECAGALAEALACYDAALEMRPGFTAYIEKRERIRRQMAARH